ncbi:MAG: TatD family hydrolase, partial [Myxococcota bacterium]|nr:TatD family hydrolase [Myxococcota bacterium]
HRMRLHRAVRAVPDEFLLVETDSPDQTPWNRRPGPNEPAFLIDVISAIAAIRDQPPEHIAQITTENALRLFAPQ